MPWIAVAADVLMVLFHTSALHFIALPAVMGKSRPLLRLFMEWGWTRTIYFWIFVGLSLCSFRIIASVTATTTSETSPIPATATTWIETTTTSSTVSRHVLDYGGISGSPTVQLNFSASSSNPDAGQQHIISVGRDVAGREIKILVVLENMVCDPRNGLRAYLWIKGADLEDEKQFCQNFQGKLIMSEGAGEVKIGTSQSWGDESAGTVNNATIRATAFYDPQPNCMCLRSLSSFCCAPCQNEPEIQIHSKPARDFKTGYCIPFQLRCDHPLYCPCGATEVPDVDYCDPFPDNDYVTVSMSLMLTYFVGGVCVMVGIIYLIPYFYRRRRRRAAEQAAATARARSRSNTEGQGRNRLSACPPPSYESSTSVEYDYDYDHENNSMKHMHMPVFPDEYEPPPPSYDTVVVKN